MKTLDLLLYGFGLMRIAIGLAPLVAARQAGVLLGFPAEHQSPTAELMARFFGVRDVGLGVLAFYAASHPAVAGFVMLFNAATDFGDLGSTLVPLVKRRGIDRAAWTSAALAVTGGLAWVALWWVFGRGR